MMLGVMDVPKHADSTVVSSVEIKGNNMATIRAKNGWTQHQAAIRCGLDDRSFQRAEEGKHSPRLHIALAIATGLSRPEVGEKPLDVRDVWNAKINRRRYLVETDEP